MNHFDDFNCQRWTNSRS